MIKISVVIPIYNRMEYLGRCIGSVQEQTLEELEIICVDDGSTDQSACVIQKLMEKDSRILLLCQENKGAGAARNLAMNNARGEYLAFLDADDYYLNKDALEKMYDACEEKQVCACASRRWRVNENEEDVEPFFRETADGFFSYKEHQVDYNFTNYLLRRELLEREKISFPVYRRFEDPPFLVRALYKAEKIAIVDTCLYCYRMPVFSERFCPESMNDLLCGLLDNMSFAREHGLEVLYRNTLRRLEYEYLYIIIRNIVPDNLRALHLLMQANQMICERSGNAGYVIRPFRSLLLFVERYDKKILEQIQREKEIVLYGAGRLGQGFLAFLEENGLSDKVACFVVSDMAGNESCIKGVSVLGLKDLPRKEERRIFVTVEEDKQEAIMESLKERAYENYEIVRGDFLSLVAGWMEREGKA